MKFGLQFALQFLLPIHFGYSSSFSRSLFDANRELQRSKDGFKFLAQQYFQRLISTATRIQTMASTLYNNKMQTCKICWLTE